MVKANLPEGTAALAPEDVAVVKLQVGREKDLALCRHLIANGMLTARQIRMRLDTTPMVEAEIIRAFRRLQSIS